MLKIVTDSSADLPSEIVRSLDITVVPLSVHFGDRTYIDGEDIDASTFYRMLHVKPILTLRDGIVTPLRRVRTRGKALQEVVEMVRAQAPIAEAYVMHAAAPEQAAALAAMIQPACAGGHVDVLHLGPAIGVHIGPGTLGVIIRREGEAANVAL